MAKKGKFYCSDLAKTNYRLVVPGNKIKITRSCKEFVENYTGVLKNGKIYSNELMKKTGRCWGKYYKLEGKILS